VLITLLKAQQVRLLI